MRRHFARLVIDVAIQRRRQQPWMGRQKEKRLNLIMRMGRMRGWPLLPGASFLYSSSVPSSTGVVEGGISEEPSGASETRNVIDVAHYRHPAGAFATSFRLAAFNLTANSFAIYGKPLTPYTRNREIS